MKKQYTRNGKSGFTFIELLVAMTLTSVIVLVLLSIVNQSSATYSNTQRSVNSISESRAFIYFFDRELATRLPGTSLFQQPGNGESPTTSDTFAFIHTLSTADQDPNAAGDLGTSAYYVAFSPSPGNTETPRLFRKILNPAQTQNFLENQSGSSLLSPDIVLDESIFDNILSFKAQLKIRSTATGGLENWTELSTEPIVAIELRIRFADETLARRLRTIDDWNRVATAPRDNELSFIRDFTRTFSVSK